MNTVNQGPIELVLCDMDGTLLMPDHSISPRNLAAVRALQAAGVHFTLATGRPPQGMREHVRQLGIELPTAAFNGGVLVSADGKSLQIAGLSPLGIRLFKATYDAQGIHTEQAINIAQLPPANQVLADIMFCYWPVSRWQPLLPAGWTLKDQGARRILADNQGREVTRIDYLQRGAERQPVSITQRAFHYQITIQNVDN